MKMLLTTALGPTRSGGILYNIIRFVKMTTHICLAPRLRIQSVTSTRPQVSMAYCLIMHRENLSLPLPSKS
jgi:hypothetical protein